MAVMPQQQPIIGYARESQGYLLLKALRCLQDSCQSLSSGASGLVSGPGQRDLASLFPITQNILDHLSFPLTNEA